MTDFLLELLLGNFLELLVSRVDPGSILGSDSWFFRPSPDDLSVDMAQRRSLVLDKPVVRVEHGIHLALFQACTFCEAFGADALGARLNDRSELHSIARRSQTFKDKTPLVIRYVAEGGLCDEPSVSRMGPRPKMIVTAAPSAK
jgi:hypothetical protein